jgi:hypothetical protein
MIRSAIHRLRIWYYRRHLKTTTPIKPVEPLPSEHTQRWCPVEAATILVGPDGTCPACSQMEATSGQLS